MTVYSDVRRVIDYFEKDIFKIDEWDGLNKPRVRAFCRDDNSSHIVKIFLDNAKSLIDPSNQKKYNFVNQGLQTFLVSSETTNNEKVDFNFLVALKKATIEFASKLSLAWKKYSQKQFSAEKNILGKFLIKDRFKKKENIVVFAKQKAIDTDLLYRLIDQKRDRLCYGKKRRIILLDSDAKVILLDSTINDYVAGKEKKVLRFLNTIFSEMYDLCISIMCYYQVSKIHNSWRLHSRANC